jgi:glycosyltransferase involved in cell wall biosynthesis
LRRFIVDRGICHRGKAKTLGDGGFPGVDPWKYHPGAKLRHRARTRRKYGIPQDDLVFGYVGRIVPDKGVAELVTAWQSLREKFPHSHLLICGHFEEVHPVPKEIADILLNDPRVHLTGWITDMPPIYAALDICVLPTYREAISGVVLEAGAMEIPTVTTRVPGSIDSLSNGVTAFAVPAKDADALRDAIAKLAQDPYLRRRMGMAARRFVSDRFSHDKIFGNLLSEYRRLIREHLPSLASS